MWKLCVVDDESNRTVVKLVRGDYSVGRAEDSTIRLTERNISRAHARIYRNGDDEWHIEDQGSYTGSFVNGERVTSQRSLKHGDTIQLGDYRLELMDEDQQAVEAKALDQAVGAAQLPDRLVVVQGPNVGTVYPLLEHKLLIGRGEECQIALDDASVSRVHVEVLRTEHGLMILDQGSSNGLRINGADLPSAMLRSGDVVELGDVRLKFVPAGVEDVVMQASPVSAQPQDAMPVAVPRTSPGRGAMALYAGGVALIGAVIVVALRSSEEAPTVTSVRVESTEVAEPAEPASPPEPAVPDGATKVLEEARALADTNIVMAHRRLADIPQDSTLRQTDAYRDIEQRWADEILRAASDSPDLEERRRLLDTVAKTPEVDADRRTRAASELAKLDENLEAVDVADLPTADAKGRKPGKQQAGLAMSKPKAVPATASTPRRSPSPITGKTQRVGMRPVVGADGEADEPRPKPEADDTPPPPPKAAPKEAPRGDSEVIRDIPF
ncbi:MAG TPA: FHA domain-containing protein [Polyangiaceae bacterium]|nr:FHA domain-containing protein [Polyangiaceae bacterium]